MLLGEIVEVVRMIASRGLKPVGNTNGHGLTPSLLCDMKSAGLSGLTFHVDGLQARPGWKGATQFEPAAYLNGTESPDSFKWLMTLLVGDGERFYGSAGPKVVELSQVWNHLVKGRYLGYVPPSVHASGRSLLALSAVDAGIRKTAAAWARAVARNPFRARRPLHLQSVMIIQPVDVLPDGRQSMCDACPDMTVHDGQLVWSCRLEERLKYGELMRLHPEKARRETEEAPT